MQNVGTQPRREKRGYGGKWKKWLAIYVAVGAVVYAIIYFAFLRHSGGYGGGGGGGSGGGGGGGYSLIPLPLFTLRYVMDRIRRR